jgi:osmotically-inducible protein OsmY
MRHFTKNSICLLLTLAASACVDKSSSPPTTTGRPVRSEEYARDNTGRNARDRDGATLTPLDQSTDPKDVTITQAIRRSISGDRTMSLDAHNVKIITIEGIVTLRGPVESVEEKLAIAGMAENTPGVLKVDNQLEVTRQ